MVKSKLTKIEFTQFYSDFCQFYSNFCWFWLIFVDFTMYKIDCKNQYLKINFFQTAVLNFLKKHEASQYNSVLNGQDPWLYGHIVTANHNEDLIASFWDNQFVFGAKVIYFSQRIRIWKKIWRARLKFVDFSKKWRFFTFSALFKRAQRARKYTRAKIFFRFEFSVKNRWLLHQKRINYLKNW